MSRIPIKNSDKKVLDNLVASERVAMAQEGENVIINIVNFPSSLNDLKIVIRDLKIINTFISEKDLDIMAEKMWRLMTSCYDRRLTEYERMGWWEFMDADNQSATFREYFVGGITRTLVAAKPRLVSTRTGGDILLQLLFQMANPFKQVDRVLNAPTNEAWLTPWKEYLLEQGVNYHHNKTVEEIHCQPNPKTGQYEITGVSIKDNQTGAVSRETAHYYISAVPVEVMGKLLNDDIIKGDPILATIKILAKDVAWMTGVQFYLNQDVPVARGHIMIVNSPWAVTAISQPQFWQEVDLSQFGDGQVKGIISVDVSNWNALGLKHKKTAKDCTLQEIMEEVWCQLGLGLRENDKPLLHKDMLVAAYIDRDIREKDGEGNQPREGLDISKVTDCLPENKDMKPDLTAPSPVPLGDPSKYKTINEEPLLVNRTRTWELRPQAYCKIPNLYFASDYVQTHTDLATMEGANEAARRAVNAILDRSGSKAKRCRIWRLHEPNLLWPFRWYDRQRFNQGREWQEDFPVLVHLTHWIIRLFKKLSSFF